jgi:hypothetical protein
LDELGILIFAFDGCTLWVEQMPEFVQRETAVASGTARIVSRL